jgi:spore coat protein CotH
MAAKKRMIILCVGLLALLVLLFVISGLGSPPPTAETLMGYEDLIFKTDRIHRIELYVEDWDRVLEAAPAEVLSRCTVVINGEQLQNVGLRATKDSSSEEMPKNPQGRYSWLLEFDRYDQSQTYHRLDTLRLNNLYRDCTMMKEYLSYRMMNEMGIPAPLCSYTTVYVNGRSLGIYLAVEAMEESFLTRWFGSDHGTLYTPQAKGSLNDVMLQYINEDPGSYPNLLNRAVTAQDQEQLIQALKQLSTEENPKDVLDVEAVIRYFAVHNFLCNHNSYTGSAVHNYHLYEQDGKLTMLPRDYNLAFGGNRVTDLESLTGCSIYQPVTQGDLQSRPMLSWILRSKQYTWLYQKYFIQLLSIDTETIIDRTYKMIAPYIYRDPSRLCTFEEFEEGVEALKEFLTLREENVRHQVRQGP